MLRVPLEDFPLGMLAVSSGILCRPLLQHLFFMRWFSTLLLTVIAASACAPQDPNPLDDLSVVCIAFEDAYVIAEGDTVSEPHAREYFDRADAICEATVPPIPNDP
jgi:hypothetical protein